MATHVNTIIVGGGIVGCSILYSLASRGLTDCLLLERLNLTSGSTWHAAGNCTHFGHDVELTNLYVNSISTYLEAQSESEQSIGLHRSGSLRLATNEKELNSYHELVPMYEQLGIPYRVVSPAQIHELHPLIELDGVLGAAYTPDDGHVDPSGTTYALAKAARNRGARVIEKCPVNTISKIDSLWHLETGQGKFTAERVIVATSFWAREMLASLSLDLPLYALEHQEIIMDQSPEVKRLNTELPIIRDPSIPGNIRQEQNGFLIGIYEQTPMAWAVDGIPPTFEQELLPSDLERLMPNLEKAMQRLPELANVGIKVVNNGPICYTPDGFPMLGPLSHHEGLWIACGFHVGIGTGGGAGKFLADWIVDGHPPYTLDCVDPQRFPKSMNKADVVDSIRQHYAAGYAVPEIA